MHAIVHSASRALITPDLARLLRWNKGAVVLGAIAWFSFFCLYGIDAAPLYRTEALRAVVARCCWHDGCWLYPVLYGEPFLTKPPGHYLAIILCSLPWGDVTTVSARLPSVFAAGAVCLTCFVLLYREGFFAWGVGVMLSLPLSLLWMDKVPSAEIDMTLTGWLTLALVTWYRAQAASLKSRTDCEESPQTQRRVSWHWGYLLASAWSLAAATLTKWPAPAFFLLTVASYTVLSRQARFWHSGRPWLALVLAAGLCLLWMGGVIRAVGPELLLQTLGQEAAYRLRSGETPPWVPSPRWVTFPLVVGAALLPWSIPAMLMVFPRYHRRLPGSARRLALFLHCWSWPNLLLWTLVPNHNVRYVLPIAPAVVALGVLGAHLLLRDLRSRWSAFRYPLRWWAGLLLCGLLAKVVFVEIVLPLRTARRNPLPIAATLQAMVPKDETLYIDKLKDDGVLFYYARAVQRWRGAYPLPEGAYLALIASEWEQWQQRGSVRLIARLHDQQGDPLLLVQYQPH
jgi:4-amino-4-deoxy-L-arabinose transferase-like glycosyltransferase